MAGTASTLGRVSSLWTPDGERKVERATPGGPPPQAGSPPAGPPSVGPEGEEMSDDEMMEVARELAAAPVEDVIANHCYGMFELAALHLSQQPPQLPQARLAIDAFGYLVDGLGERLGQHAATLNEGLGQLRLAFVRIAEAGGAAMSGGPGGGDAGDSASQSGGEM